MASVKQVAPAIDRPAPGLRNLMRAHAMRAVVLLEAIIAALVIYGLWSLHDQVVDSAQTMVTSFATMMASQADSTLTLAETALRATRLEVEEGVIAQTTPGASDVLRSRVSAMPMFRELVVLDLEGRVIATSVPLPDVAPPLAGTESLATSRGAALSDHDAALATQARLNVGKPGLSPVDGKPAIPLTMPWFDREQRFAGMVDLVADAEFLDGSFSTSAPTPDTTMAIYRHDRELVSDGPGDGTARLLPQLVIDGLWSGSTDGSARIITLPNGDERMVAAQQLAWAPLLLVVTRDMHAVLAAWTREAIVAAAFTASALLVTFLLALRNGREQWLRRASQAALEKEKVSALRAFEAAQEGHWEWNPTTRESHYSPRMKELLGLDRHTQLAPASGLPDEDRVDTNDRIALREAFIAHLNGASPRFEARFRVARDDGSWRHIQARGQVLRDGAGEPVLFSGTASDVTEQVEAQRKSRELEDQLQRARKMESLGTLAGGVAHDFNNILAAVIGYAELARDKAIADTPLARQLDQVLAAGQRGRSLVARILSFSQTGTRAGTLFALEPLLDEVLHLLDASHPSTVRTRKQIDPGLGENDRIFGDATVVFEVVMNLCTNAVQAMPTGGELSLTLDVTQSSTSKQVWSSTLAPGRWLRLVVSDTGEGIDAAVMARMFEPFFTTKGPHQGTGLGLAIVHSVMEEIGGGIDVESTPGAGTRFTLWFPCTSDATRQSTGMDSVAIDASKDAPLPRYSASVPVASLQDASPGSGETVMLVDDEPALVALGEELLAGIGYEAVGFASAGEALSTFMAQPVFHVIGDLFRRSDHGTVTTARRDTAQQLPYRRALGFDDA